MCVNSFHHICPVKITISYVYARETIVPLWKTKLCGKLPDHWVLMFCLENKWFGCCNVYLCALCFCIIAGSLTCWCKPEQKVFCLTSWWKGERVLTWFWYIKVITITCISSFFKVAKYSTIWPAHYFFIFFCNNNSCIFAVILHSLCREFDGFPPRFSEKCFLSCQWTEIIIKELKICPPLPWQGSCSLFDRNCLSRKQMCWVLYYSEFDFHGKWLCIITTGNLNTYLTKFSWCFVHLLLESQSHKSCRTYLCDEIIMHFALMMTSHFRRGRGVFIVLLLQCRKLQC